MDKKDSQNLAGFRIQDWVSFCMKIVEGTARVKKPKI